MDHLKPFLKGLFDSLKGTTAIFYIDKDIKQREIISRQSPPRNRIRQRVSNVADKKVQKDPVEKTYTSTLLYRCIILNGCIYLLVVLMFEYLLFPSLKTIFNSGNVTSSGIIGQIVEHFATLLYQITFRIPVYMITKLTNMFYFQDIADKAYLHTRGKRKFFDDLLIMIADMAFNFVIEYLFVVQASLTSYIPIYGVGYFLSLLQYSLLYSLYMFEYKWYNMGWELHKRLTCIEVNWVYFAGYGLPLALATNLSDSFVISGSIFALLFPFFIVSANVTTPVNGPSCNRIPVFSLVVAIGNRCFKTLSTKKQKK